MIDHLDEGCEAGGAEGFTLAGGLEFAGLERVIGQAVAVLKQEQVLRGYVLC